jgi:hypothetical protein
VGLFQRTGAGTALRAAVAAACCALLNECAHRSRPPAGGGACAPCPTPQTPARPEAAPGPRGALEQFLGAAGRGDFEAAFRLLASPLRARYTPARLASDYAAVRGLAQDKLARLRASLDADWRIGADEASLPVGEGKRARLVREPEGWRIAALE